MSIRLKKKKKDVPEPNFLDMSKFITQMTKASFSHLMDSRGKDSVSSAQPAHVFPINLLITTTPII